jgi:hypothetical protein
MNRECQSSPAPETGLTWLSEYSYACESVDIAIARSRDPQLTLRYCEDGDLQQAVEVILDHMRDLIANVRKEWVRKAWLESFDVMRREKMAQLPSFRVMMQ